MSPEERSAEIAEFMRYAFEVWPRERERLRPAIAQRCSRCILSEKHSPLIDGICRYCRADLEGVGPDRSAVEASTSGDTALTRELNQLLESYQGKGPGLYDALVMFSGGKDSALLLHTLRRDFPRLRVLAVMLDNGFTSSIAAANVQRVAAIIHDVDHCVLKPQASLYRHTFTYALTHLNQGGCYASVERLAGDLGLDICRNLAASQRIPLVLHGGTRAQVERNLGVVGYETSRASERQRRSTILGFVLREIYDEEDMKYWWDGSSWPEEQIPRVIFPFCAWPYDEQLVRRKVVDLGLFQEGNDNPLTSNFDLLPVLLAVDTFHLGYSSYEPDFAQLIRQGKADRRTYLCLFEAIEYLARRGTLLPRCIADALAKLHLTHEQIGLPRPAEARLSSAG